MKKETKRTGLGLEPLHDRVLIKEVQKEDKKTVGGIIIPDSVKDTRSSRKGTVVAVGKGIHKDGKLVPLSVKVGDAVLFGWGDDVMINEQEYVLVREAEIMAIVK